MKCHEIQVPSSPTSSAEPMTSGQKTMQKGSPWAAQSMARPLTGTSKFQVSSQGRAGALSICWFGSWAKRDKSEWRSAESIRKCLCHSFYSQGHPICEINLNLPIDTSGSIRVCHTILWRNKRLSSHLSRYAPKRQFLFPQRKRLPHFHRSLHCGTIPGKSMIPWGLLRRKAFIAWSRSKTEDQDLH